MRFFLSFHQQKLMGLKKFNEASEKSGGKTKVVIFFFNPLLKCCIQTEKDKSERNGVHSMVFLTAALLASMLIALTTKYHQQSFACSKKIKTIQLGIKG